MDISIWIPKPWVSKKDDKLCKNCKHFHQHYVRTGYTYPRYTYKETNAGHCAYPRMKDREENDSCKFFERGEHM